MTNEMAQVLADQYEEKLGLERAWLTAWAVARELGKRWLAEWPIHTDPEDEESAHKILADFANQLMEHSSDILQIEAINEKQA